MPGETVEVEEGFRRNEAGVVEADALHFQQNALHARATLPPIARSERIARCHGMMTPCSTHLLAEHAGGLDLPVRDIPVLS